MAIKGAPFEIHITIKNLTLVQIFYCLRVKIRSILIHFDFKCVGVLWFWGILTRTQFSPKKEKRG